MILTACEGRFWQYEVAEHEDGYAVLMRDRDTGDLDADGITLFRTMPVAFAYAEMSAAFDRYVAEEGDEAGGETARLVETSERTFLDLSGRRHDGGIPAAAAEAWARWDEDGPRRALH
ncbi:hypothetical protein [Methylobacterium oryzihabitans]|uniref:Uncharacterized protein n=1 Tax=Methylobacterium oryzihabitans TaxID=2499852 RepID=A0A3S2YXE1_9HYPH|nr:hypothetical protein [Methylobacterium oryzihabitans]RVU21530.1 hypothetical protein EOE48_00265 [Methylobacterium oryzihabitans]